MRFSSLSAQIRFGLVAISLVLILVVVAWQCVFTKPVVIAVHTWPGYESLFLAQREGWLNPDKARLFETRSATESIQAVLAGEVDGAALTLDEALKVRANGVPVTVILVFDMSAGADMLVAQAGIKQLPDLKGKRIGYEANAVGALMLSETLKAAKLSQEDVKLISMPINQHAQAWLEQRVDAVITYEPTASQLLSAGGNKLFDSGHVPDTILDVLVIRSDKVDVLHASSLRHLLAVHFQTLAYFQHNPHDAIYRMAAHLGLPATGVLRAFKGLVLPDAEENYRLLQAPSAQVLRNAEKLLQIMKTNNLLEVHDSLDGLINADYLPREF